MSMTTTDTSATETQGAVERCGQCGAAAAPDQRYCVNCGFHRRNAPDPVARYLAEASAARARVVAAEAAAATRRRITRLGLRPVALLVALALLAGILIGNATAGRSGGNAGNAGNRTHQTARKPKPSPVKNATGSAYVQQEENLPDSVSP